MNWTLLIIGIAVLALLAQLGPMALVVTTHSSCAEFVSATNAILSRPDIGSLGMDERSDMCKIPAYQIKTGQCKTYDWVAASKKMYCDTSTESGSLTADGIKVWT